MPFNILEFPVNQHLVPFIDEAYRTLGLPFDAVVALLADLGMKSLVTARIEASPEVIAGLLRRHADDWKQLTHEVMQKYSVTQ